MRFKSDKSSISSPILGTHLQIPNNNPPVSTTLKHLRHSTTPQSYVRHSSLNTDFVNVIQPSTLSNQLLSKTSKTIRFSLANAPVSDSDPYMRWHLRCGHRCNIEDLANKCDGVPALRKPKNLQLCDACVGAKSTNNNN